MVTAESTTLRAKRWMPIVIIMAAVLTGHAPLGYLHLRSLWAQAQYQYFPFVLAAFAWLLYRRIGSAPIRIVSYEWGAIPWLFLICSLGLIGLAVLVVSPWLAFVSLIISLAAMLLWVAQQRQVTHLAGIWLLLWLLVPIPLGQDQHLIQYMQHLSSRMSSSLLDALQILHVTEGNKVALPDRELFVDEACSGIISVMSILACSVIVAVWCKRPPIHLLLLALLSMTLAIFMNVARISLIAIAHVWFKIDFATGAPHEGLGLCLYVLMFGALICTDHLLVALLARIPEPEVGDRLSKNILVRGWNSFVAWHIPPNKSGTIAPESTPAGARQNIASRPMLSVKVATIASVPFVLLGVLQLIWVPTPDTAQARSAVDRAIKLNRAMLPKRIGKWECKSYDFVEREVYSDFGRYSHTFKYRHTQDPTLEATVSLDFPYLGGWHDLCMCYVNVGWQLSERKVISSEDQQSSWKFVEASLDSNDHGKATVYFAAFDVSGEPGEPASDAVLFRPWFRVRRRLLHQISPQLFQVQVFAPVATGADERLHSELRDLFVTSRTLLKAVVAPY